MIREDTGKVRFANLSAERVNREKDSQQFPSRSIEACMKELGIASEVDRYRLGAIAL
jgi:predicted NodU family carbamoyl transferase